MFLLVAIMALYLGANNVKRAFTMAPFGQWELINWSLFIVGSLMVVAGIACAWQANKDYKERQRQKDAERKAETDRRVREFMYDDELKAQENTKADYDEYFETTDSDISDGTDDSDE